MNLNQFFDEVRKNGHMFGATALRKNDKKEGGVVVAKKGEPFSSTYRLGVKATNKPAATRLAPGDRKNEDRANNVLTVFDMNKFDKEGNRGAFRRLNLAEMVEVKISGNKYEIVYNEDGEVTFVGKG